MKAPFPSNKGFSWGRCQEPTEDGSHRQSGGREYRPNFARPGMGSGTGGNSGWGLSKVSTRSQRLEPSMASSRKGKENRRKWRRYRDDLF